MATTPEPTPSDDIAADIDGAPQPVEPAGPGLLARLAAELIGTYLLVLVGLAIGGTYESPFLAALGFGFVVLALILAIGHVSGAHINPAVTMGFWISGRFPGRDVAPYILAQTVGAIAGGGTLWALTVSRPDVLESGAMRAIGADYMSGQSIGWGEHSPGGYGLVGSAIGELLATVLLVALVLAATSKLAPAGYAPIGISLGLFALILFAIPFSNAGLNPARATGSAVFANAWAMEQLWLWWVLGIAGGAFVGLMFRAFGPLDDIESVDVYDEE